MTDRPPQHYQSNAASVGSRTGICVHCIQKSISFYYKILCERIPLAERPVLAYPHPLVPTAPYISHTIPHPPTHTYIAP